MKNSGVLLVLLVSLWSGLSATDSFKLIRTERQQPESVPFEMKRDLFGYAAAKSQGIISDAARDPVITEAQVEQAFGPLDSSAPPTRFDIVFLGAIVRQNSRCALIAINGDMQVVEEGESLENGWRIEQVTLSRLSVMTGQGSMMLALEGYDDE